tara:strand:- start:1879 stop:2154 length:276 start_codon:yes stop_codon:yes gene_type:complete
MKLDKFYEWMEATNQNFLNPTEYNGNNYTCNECGNLLEVSDVCECINEYIEEYIIPNESNENIKLYYKGCLEYDNEYIKEHKKYNTEYKTK